jgi:membrane-bound lytic murein transglycosylase F
VKSTLFAFSVVFAVALHLGCEQTPRHMGDVEEIRASGELRVVVRPGFDRSQPGDGDGLDETSMIEQLAARIGVRVRWIQARRHDQVLAFLREGVADLAVSRFSPSALLEGGAAATAEVDWVEDLLVAARSSGFENLESAAGATVHLHRSRTTESIRSFLAEHGLRIEEVPEEVSIEETMRRVRSGRYNLTVVDSQLAHTAATVRGIEILGALGGRRALVWGVRERSPQLRLAIDQFFFAERVLERSSRIAECRDLREVRRAGVLRLVTRNSATTCFVEKGGIGGFEYDLASEFARSLGVRLDLSIPPSGTDPLEWLEMGYGDVMALHEPVSPFVEGAFLVSPPYRDVDLVSVVSTRRAPPYAVEDLQGIPVAAARSVTDLCLLLPLAEPMRAYFDPDKGADAFNAMLEVARGEAPLAVVDEDAAKLEIRHRTDLQQGTIVLPRAGLSWVLNPSSPRLYREVSRFLAQARKSGMVRQLVLNEFGSWKPPRLKTLLPIPEGNLSQYDELLQWVGREYEIDWRLLASLMYEESRFDPDAVGPGGSSGLFQFMPFTWKELGVEDPHHPQEAAEAGARYLRQLMDEFEDLALQDRVAMAIASYNVGPRHLYDARALAREMGFDPDRWRGSVETAMLLLDDPTVSRRFPAGVCRCRRAVGYTRRILRRYAAYTEQFPPA